MIAFIWIVAAIGLALWSLACWGLWRVLVLDPAWTRDIAEAVQRLPQIDEIEAWIPGIQALLQSLVQLAQALLQWLGVYAPLVAWGLWAAGAALLAIVAGMLTLIVVLLRDKDRKAASR